MNEDKAMPRRAVALVDVPEGAAHHAALVQACEARGMEVVQVDRDECEALIARMSSVDSVEPMTPPGRLIRWEFAPSCCNPTPGYFGQTDRRRRR